MVAGDGDSLTERYLEQIGVRPTPRATCPFDPGYDPVTLESHLEQSAHLMGTLKISMACWLVADEGATRRKVQRRPRSGVPTVAGGGPFETAVAQRALPAYLDLCADVGLTRSSAARVHRPAARARERSPPGGRARAGARVRAGREARRALHRRAAEELIATGPRWLDAGARRLVVEARESAAGRRALRRPPASSTAAWPSARRRVRVPPRRVRGAEQGQPVRAARALRARGPARATSASRSSCASRSTAAGCTRTPSRPRRGAPTPTRRPASETVVAIDFSPERATTHAGSRRSSRWTSSAPPPPR